MLPLNSEQYEMRRDNSLLIRSLQISKLGEYICDAYNGLGAPGTWSVKVKTLRPINVPEAEESEYGQYLVTAYSPTIIVTPRPHIVTEPPRVEEPVYEPPTYNGLYMHVNGFLFFQAYTKISSFCVQSLLFVCSMIN